MALLSYSLATTHAATSIHSNTTFKEGLPADFSKALNGDPRWSDQFALPGCNGAVNATAVAGDGSVYLGGGFTACGDTLANHIVRYEPATDSFHALGNGAVNGVNDIVFSLAIDGNRVYVGGRFTQAGELAVNRIAAWDVDSSQWSALGGDIANGLSGGSSPTAFAITVAGDGSLYVGGSFTQAGAVAVNNIARWDGAAWSPLGSDAANGVGGLVGSSVYALALSGTRVYVGGYFNQAGGNAANRVAFWDTNTNTWSPLGNAPNNGVSGGGGLVFALAVTDSGLVYAGGTFTQAGGVAANSIASWESGSGVWSPLSGGFNGTQPSVQALAVVGSGVYAGGNFGQVDGIAASRVAYWDGNTWSTLGSGVGTTINHPVNALAISGSDLYAGGDFPTTGTTLVNRVARWDGNAWAALDGDAGNGVAVITAVSTASISALASSGTHLYAAGYFDYAGTSKANRIARWDGNAWSLLGTPQSNGVNGSINALVVTNTGIYAGGEFTQAGGVSVNNIAFWDGVAWSALGTDASNGVNGPVMALAVSGNNVFVGGDFTQAGGAAANRIAVWNGAAWSTLGSGVNVVVRALAVTNAGLYAGGDFTQAGGVSANRIALWNNTAWSALGTGANNGVTGGISSVRALVAAGSNLYVGGNFTQAGGVAANRAAVWNGNGWAALGEGLDSIVSALTSHGNDLYAGGYFTHFFSQGAGVTANRIARWDGANWSALGADAANGVTGRTGGLVTGINALAVLGTRLYMGGAFTQAGGKVAYSLSSYNLDADTIFRDGFEDAATP